MTRFVISSVEPLGLPARKFVKVNWFHRLSKRKNPSDIIIKMVVTAETTLIRGSISWLQKLSVYYHLQNEQDTLEKNNLIKMNIKKKEWQDKKFIKYISNRMKVRNALVNSNTEVGVK
jgi:RNA-binding protein YhbY